MSKFLMILTALTLGQAAFAANDDIECQVTKVLDKGSFENANDFTFADYPFVVYEKETTVGQSLIVGAFAFGEDSSKYDYAEIKVTKTAGKTVVVAIPEDSGNAYKLTVEGTAGLLEFTEGGITSKVARLTCEVPQTSLNPFANL